MASLSNLVMISSMDGHARYYLREFPALKRKFISPSVHNRGEVMTTRDVEGAVRFLSTGNLKLDRETREFHRDKVTERRKAEGIRSPSQDYVLVERDVMQVARCRYERRPLGQ